MPTIQQALQHGWQLQQQGQLGQAESIYRQVIAQVPGSADAHVYLGIVLFDQRRFAEAEVAYREGLQLRDAFPIAWNNLGNALRMQNRIEAADRCFERSIQLQPDYLSPLKNRGTLWIWSGEIERGLHWYQQALALAPDDAELHRNLGVIFLLQGRFAEGWPEYRYRWQMPGLTRPRVAAPIWRGESVAGKTVLLYPEQGLGDTIHFVRMAAELKHRGARTILMSSSRMIPLLGSVPGVDQLVLDGSPIPETDYQASLIEVADHLGLDTQSDVAGLPYLSVSENLAGYWKSALMDLSGFRVGICWQGNPNHHADLYRSVPLATFAPLAALEEVQLIALQQGFGSEQIDHVPFHHRIYRLPNSLDHSGAFLDTAAIMQQLDLVITTDTSTAHLAGALGIPTWLLLGKVPDWRWLLDADRTGWYPSMRLYRQTAIGDWDSVMHRVAADLSQR